jgi:hypothetical protein
MGLDMFAYAVPEDKVVDDFSHCAEKPEELHYWRKHHDLHGWMERLYRNKGGTAEQFNCVAVRLTLEDLAILDRDLMYNRLPETTGFFFGHFPPNEESLRVDLEFLQKARDAIAAGKAVYYDSWW